MPDIFACSIKKEEMFHHSKIDENHAKEFDYQRKHCNVTMIEFYDYRLQHRNTNDIALFWDDQLKQQYIVDAYATIEQTCLNYLHLH